jgi:hypothetical protein
VQESIALKTIDKDASLRRPKEQRDPPDPSRPKTTLPQDAKQKGPRDTVKGFGDVHLEKEGTLLS